MPRGDRLDVRKNEANREDEEEARSLLSSSSADDDGLVVDSEVSHASISPPRPARPSAPNRQSSISRPPANGQPRTPRTPNRVRFDLDDGSEDEGEANGYAGSRQPSSWMEEEDYLNSDHSGSRRSSTGHTVPLLTNI